MVTRELMETVMQERMWEAAELRRQHQARASQERGAAPRSGPSLERIRRFPFLSSVTRGFRTASAP